MDVFNATWALTTLLLWLRLGVLLALSPWAQAIQAPTVIWVLLTLVLAAMLCTALPLRTPLPSSLHGLAVLALGELLLGSLFGLALHAAFASLALAGRLLDLQMGFGMAGMLDPVTRAQGPVVGVALTLLGLSVFLAADMHHAVIRGAAQITLALPPGTSWALPAPATLSRMAGQLYAAAVVIAAPVLFMLLLTELTLDFASRVLPQLNVLFVGIPVKLLVGLSMLAIAAPGMSSALHQLFSSGLFDPWRGLAP